MSSDRKMTDHAEAVSRKYGPIGATIGFVGGLVIGALVTGPQLGEMEIGALLWVNAACAFGGGLVGYLAGYMMTGAAAGGPSPDVGATDVEDD